MNIKIICNECGAQMPARIVIAGLVTPEIRVERCGCLPAYKRAVRVGGRDIIPTIERWELPHELDQLSAITIHFIKQNTELRTLDCSYSGFNEKKGLIYVWDSDPQEDCMKSIRLSSILSVTIADEKYNVEG